ncbi:hypothetical protein ACFQ0B_09570 [Nonomuraea thailandensis]
MVANVSVTLQIQGGGRGFGTADKAAELVEAALVKRKQAAGTG